MGFSAGALLVAGLVGSVAASAMAPKPKIPKATAPKTSTPQEIDEASRAAQRRQRQMAAGATGRSDTILTGSQGLAPTATQGKTLLGQ